MCAHQCTNPCTQPVPHSDECGLDERSTGKLPAGILRIWKYCITKYRLWYARGSKPVISMLDDTLFISDYYESPYKNLVNTVHYKHSKYIKQNQTFAESIQGFCELDTRLHSAQCNFAIAGAFFKIINHQMNFAT